MFAAQVFLENLPGRALGQCRDELDDLGHLVGNTLKPATLIMSFRRSTM